MKHKILERIKKSRSAWISIIDCYVLTEVQLDRAKAGIYDKNVGLDSGNMGFSHRIVLLFTHRPGDADFGIHKYSAAAAEKRKRTYGDLL